MAPIDARAGPEERRVSEPEASQPDATEPPSPAASRLPEAATSDDLFRRDARGRTPLFDAAEQGWLDEVEAMLANLPGTGFFPQRLGLIEMTDNEGLTAADVAERSGQTEIAELLRYRAWSMITFG